MDLRIPIDLGVRDLNISSTERFDHRYFFSVSIGRAHLQLVGQETRF